ncbi:MAG: TonB-dependent receptor [Deltaproteobacteria bacterium]|nr:TonB-dependent receptor [Deltaproteobacteria bacterium]
MARVVAADVPDEVSSGDVPDAGPDAGFFTADMPVYESVVRGYRVLPTDETTGFAETIAVSDQAKTLETVPEVLSRAVGVQVRSLGGLGSYAAASIRGSTSSQVPVYLDGVLLNAGGFPSVDIGDLSLDLLESIEVYRGSTPVSLGLGGIGGAVSLETRKLDKPLTEVAASYGSWNTGRLMVLRADRIGGVRGLAISSVQGSEGDFEYLNRNGTLLNDDDDRIQRRENNRHVAYSGLVKLDGEAGAWSWAVIDDLYAKRQGVPGIDSVPTKDAELRTLRNAASVSLVREFHRNSSLRLDGSYLALREDFDDTKGEVGVGFQRTVTTSDTVGGSALAELEPIKGHKTDVRLEIRFERLDERELVKDEPAEPSTRVLAGLGLEHEWRILDALHVVPAVRLEVHRARFGGGPVPGTVGTIGPRSSRAFYWSPSLGVLFEAVPGLTLRANAGRYVRSPDLAELFGDRGSVVGNPELDPEIGINADAGFTYILEDRGFLSSLRVDAAWFGSWADDLIAYVQNSQNTIRPENVDSARILGAEASLRVLLGDLVSLESNYTYLNGINLSDKPYHNGKRLPGRPAHEVYGRVEVGKSVGNWGGAGWADVDYAGESYLDQANLKEDALARLLFGLGLRVERPREGVALTVEVKNLFDTITVRGDDGRLRPLRDYEAFPLPGRTVLATVHWEL